MQCLHKINTFYYIHNNLQAQYNYSFFLICLLKKDNIEILYKDVLHCMKWIGSLKNWM